MKSGVKGEDFFPQAVAESGLRAVLHQGLIDVWPHWVEKWGDGQTQIRRAAQVYGQWHGAEGGRIQVGLGPHSPYGATELLLRSAATRALEWGTSLHVHLAESEDEVRQIQEAYNLTPAEYLAEGQEVDVKVLEVNRQERRISLGLKQMTEEPWTAAARSHPVGSVVEGKVTKLTNFGAFVEIEKGVEGLLHVSDLSWTERVSHPADRLVEKDARRSASVYARP